MAIYNQYAHSIKNPQIVHMLKLYETSVPDWDETLFKFRYLCNRSVLITKSKSTKKWKNVTCQNCIKIRDARRVRSFLNSN